MSVIKERKWLQVFPWLGSQLLLLIDYKLGDWILYGFQQKKLVNNASCLNPSNDNDLAEDFNKHP